MNYVIWDSKDEGNSCVLLSIKNVKRDFELQEGIPKIADFPKDAFFPMDPQYKKNVKLTDNLINTDSLIVVSSKLKDFLQAQQLKNVEYLRVSIINHKGRLASNDYFIVHPIIPQDCLDIEKSGATWNDIIPTDIDSVDKLVIDEAKIDPEVALFRLKYFCPPVLVRRDLAKAITQAGFTGVLWVELDEYGE